jgi:hypothetical protein
MKISSLVVLTLCVVLSCSLGHSLMKFKYNQSTQWPYSNLSKI